MSVNLFLLYIFFLYAEIVLCKCLWVKSAISNLLLILMEKRKKYLFSPLLDIVFFCYFNSRWSETHKIKSLYFENILGILIRNTFWTKLSDSWNCVKNLREFFNYFLLFESFDNKKIFLKFASYEETIFCCPSIDLLSNSFIYAGVS